MTTVDILCFFLYVGTFLCLLAAVWSLSKRMTVLEGMLTATINTVKAEQDARVRHQFKENEND